MTISLDTLTLPDELIWIDEFYWNPIRVEEKFSLSGVRNISESLLPTNSGRPITLESDNSWIDRQDLITLHNWSRLKNYTMTLTLHDNSIYQVRFRHTEPPVIEYENLLNLAFVDDDTIYKLVLKLEVA